MKQEKWVNHRVVNHHHLEWVPHNSAIRCVSQSQIPSSSAMLFCWKRNNLAYRSQTFPAPEPSVQTLTASPSAVQSLFVGVPPCDLIQEVYQQ